MSQAKKPSSETSGVDADGAPRSNVQLKTRPLLDRQLAQLAEDCEAGLIEPEEMARLALAACDKWSAPYLTSENQAQVKAWMEELVAVDLAVRRAWEETK